MGLRPGRPTNDPNQYVALALQPAKGTAGSTFFFARYSDGSGFEVERDIQREREGGDGQEVGLSYVSMVKADGQLQSNARAGLIARSWAGALGADAVGSAAVPSLARHTAVPAATLPYWTFDQHWADQVERSLDNVMTGVTLEGEAGRPWRITQTFLSGGTVFQRDVASALTPAYERDKPYFYPNGSYVFDGAASYSADFTKIKVELQRNVDDAIQTTGLGRDDVIALNFDATLEGTLKYTSRDFYNKVMYRGGSVVLSELATGAVRLAQHQMVQVASGVYATGLMQLDMPLIEWTDARVNRFEPDGQTMFLDVVGMTVKGATHSLIAITDVSGAENTSFAP